MKKHPDQKYLLMRNDKPLNDTQIREVIRTEMGSKDEPFGVQMIRRLFSTYLMQEKKANPRAFKEYARKMGTSVQMLMDNYMQIEDEDQEEYQGIGDLSSDEEEKKPKRASTRVATKTNKKAKK